MEMPKNYHRNADEMLFKTDNVCQKVDAKRQMLNTVCQNTHSKNQMLKKCKPDLSSNQYTEKVMKDRRTKEKVNMLQCPSSLKQILFFRVNNNETQSRNSRAVALSTHARLRFNSSMSLLLGAFDYCECNKKIVSNYIITTGNF